jgi:hypothetical protein
MHEIPDDRQFLFQAAIEKFQILQATMQKSMTTLVKDTARELGLDPEAKWQVTRGPNGWVLQESEVSE